MKSTNNFIAGETSRSSCWARPRARGVVSSWTRPALWTLVFVLTCWSTMARAGAGEPALRARIERVEIDGTARTRDATLLELLPRAPPATYSDAELSELERRVGNLGLFDAVRVRRAGSVLHISVREKWTLVPEFDLARGTTLQDMYVLLGVTEYNVLGRGSLLRLSTFHVLRGYGFEAGFQEHVYRRDRWSLGGEGGYGSAYLRFDGGSSWYNTTGALYLWSTSTPLLSDHARYEVGAFYKHERISDVVGDVRPPDGHVGGLSMMLTWDSYEWHDLTPHGFSASLNLAPGFFFGPHVPQRRYRADAILLGAYKLHRSTSLVGRLNAGVCSLGNANHTLLIGSVEGVRGLTDARYFSWAQAYTNLELRAALRLGARWALQGVLFADAGGFEQQTARGGRGAAGYAFSGGAGVRLIPTWLRGLLLRFDVARLVAPERSFFYQYGVSQYF
jgi:hypothetical protein